MIHAKKIGALCLATTSFLLYGCLGSGSIIDPDLIIHDPITGQEILHAHAKKITWGPAQPQLPAGSTLDCSGTVNGHPVDVYTAPDGSQWFVDEDGHNHKNLGNHVDCGGQSQNIDRDPEGIELNSPTGPIDTSISYSFNTDTDQAKASFTLPVSHVASRYVSPADMPFYVQDSGVQLPNGDIRVKYTGTINDVLGALWWIGVTEVSFTDSNGVAVNIQWAEYMNVVTIDYGTNTETIVMTPTNLANWNND